MPLGCFRSMGFVSLPPRCWDKPGFETNFRVFKSGVLNKHHSHPFNMTCWHSTNLREFHVKWQPPTKIGLASRRRKFHWTSRRKSQAKAGAGHLSEKDSFLLKPSPDEIGSISLSRSHQRADCRVQERSGSARCAAHLKKSCNNETY